LIGVGGTFPLPVYTVWFEHYEIAHPGCRFRYPVQPISAVPTPP
jgi:ABC-type phosphate transport system substrate-binding protein